MIMSYVDLMNTGLFVALLMVVYWINLRVEALEKKGRKL